ncbi:MAG: hypothetical protein QXM31_02795 [Candidatus Woesearchaeota archaeon]
MRCRNLAFIAVIVLVLALAGCAKAECKKDADCARPHFIGKCVDKKCSFTPIPNECGNLKCERDAGENECTCEPDCGKCSGKVGKYLEKVCNEKKDACIQLVPATSQKPITLTKELATGGTKISVTTLFSQPFNTKRDQFELEFGINVLSPAMTDLKISRLELTGMTPDKRTILLADKAVGRNLFEGSKLKEKLIISFPTADIDGELTNLILKIYIDYVLVSGTVSTPKSATLQNNYQALKFLWATPEVSPGCPVCEKIPGMKESCSEATNFFCEYVPIAGACGNGICDASENECICPADCGPCAGGGAYTSRSCVASNCVSQLRQGIAAKPQSLLDERDMGPFEMQNTYRFNSPFNTKQDKFVLELRLKQKDESISSVKVTDARLLDGSEEISFAVLNKELTTEAQAFEMRILPGPAEQERALTLRVWYEYVQNGETKQGDFTKPLGKVVIVSPDV